MGCQAPLLLLGRRLPLLGHGVRASRLATHIPLARSCHHCHPTTTTNTATTSTAITTPTCPSAYRLTHWAGMCRVATSCRSSCAATYSQRRRRASTSRRRCSRSTRCTSSPTSTGTSSPTTCSLTPKVRARFGSGTARAARRWLPVLWLPARAGSTHVPQPSLHARHPRALPSAHHRSPRSFEHSPPSFDHLPPDGRPHQVDRFRSGQVARPDAIAILHHGWSVCWHRTQRCSGRPTGRGQRTTGFFGRGRWPE